VCDGGESGGDTIGGDLERWQAATTLGRGMVVVRVVATRLVVTWEEATRREQPDHTFSAGSSEPRLWNYVRELETMYIVEKVLNYP
jgi:hypothetical protein